MERLVVADSLPDPDNPAEPCPLGPRAVMLGQFAQALPVLRRAAPGGESLEQSIWQALCLDELGRRGEALEVLETAARSNLPQTYGAHFALGLMMARFGRHEEAARLFTGCAVMQPTRPDARHHLGKSLQASGHIDAAVEAFTGAMRLDPGNADIFVDLSSALCDAGRFAEGLIAAQVASVISPACPEAHNNIGYALLSLNRSIKALPAYETAIALRAGFTHARFGHAVALLKSGDFVRGWRQYEARWQDCQIARSDLGPAWRGEDLRNTTILLHAEQGLGDTLQFVRFAPLVAARGARVVLEVPASLVELLHGVEGVADVIACGDPLPPIDWHCPMASLPLLFDLRIDAVPAAPYLRAPASFETPCCHEHADLRVGLVWAGDARPSDTRSNLIDRRRSTSLGTLAPLFAIQGVRFASYQLGPPRAQIEDAGLPVVDAMHGVTSFADTAARLAGCDLLISVDTAMVHLAGGLGKPVWMLSRFDGCWRWLEETSETPWYPSMRIFRQPTPGD
ncbi:tetratricopeptide repeat protein [Lichenicoccus roseus]|uniref:Tetratricopeptide repeat protein n=1 Tax=Lichenicoccus roseus TaxID=2683649 RepID=A0A5R9JDL8_9PROT|nr:tetratricopeptide repeat protein [Lichenicoccus roseus]TLU72388.1 tetratricopeptide repeat protein [Lichenicoccus roseus]